MAHVHQHVGAARERLHLRERPAVARVDQRAARVAQTECECDEIGLEVPGIADLERPFSLPHRVAEPKLHDLGSRALPRQGSATRLVDGEAATVARTRDEIGVVDAAIAEQLLGHARQRRRAVHLEVGHAAGALVPASQDEPRVVAAVVVVEMGEEEMGHPRGVDAELEQPMMGAEAMVQHDDIAADLDHIAGAHSPQGRCRCPRPSRRILTQSLPGTSISANVVGRRAFQGIAHHASSTPQVLRRRTHQLVQISVSPDRKRSASTTC